MVNGFAEGANDFYDFATDIEEVKYNIPDAIERALEQTADDYIEEVTDNIEQKTTKQDGTLDSRTSPFEPGTTNDSSDDGFHISETEAWDSEVIGQDAVVVKPVEAVRDRASWLEHGTAAHGPKGDVPMFFFADGSTIIVGDRDWSYLSSDRVRKKMEEGEDKIESEDVIQEILDPEGAGTRTPTEVEGINPQRFFHEAAETIRSEKRLSKNLENELKREFEKQFGAT